MVVYAGQGDARRSIALLWRAAAQGKHTAPGPRPSLTLDTIVDAAIAIADADGMSGLSMRAVGDRLGRTAMALYTYIPSKAELIDLMYDRALAELPRDYSRDAGWRPAITAWADDLWAFYLRHPWMLHVSQARPVLGPNEFASLETVVRILHNTGLSPGTLRRLVSALFHFVRGAVQVVAESRRAPVATGVSDEVWWFARSALVEEVAPDLAERFPYLMQLEREGSAPLLDESLPYLEREARESFTVGLAVLLDGIEATIARGKG